MRVIALTWILSIFLTTTLLKAQRLQVSQNGRFLETEQNEPFFWLADTAWELFHRCSLDDIRFYLSKRKEQGFNVIQAVGLAELDGLNTSNVYGEVPLIDNDPGRPNEKYFDFVEEVVDLADSMGIYIALLPTWGDKLFRNTWGVGPEIFHPDNAFVFGEWMGRRFGAKDNIIWVLGGDRNPRDNHNDVLVWRRMAQGISKGAGSKNLLMTFHPQPHNPGGSSTWFHNDEWLDFNMHQTGHCPNQGTYLKITHDYQLKPVKPVLDGEPLYEDHPNCFNSGELGYSTAQNIRKIMYWNVFAGAFGQTYGCHDVWQMYSNRYQPVNGPLRPWKKALNLPLANQVKHLKNLMLSRPYLTRIPDSSLVDNTDNHELDYVIATRDTAGTYAMIYFPNGQATLLNTQSLKGSEFRTWWYDPRTGVSFKGPNLQEPRAEIMPPSSGSGNDWILVIDALESEAGKPGKN